MNLRMKAGEIETDRLIMDVYERLLLNYTQNLTNTTWEILQKLERETIKLDYKYKVGEILYVKINGQPVQVQDLAEPFEPASTVPHYVAAYTDVKGRFVRGTFSEFSLETGPERMRREFGELQEAQQLHQELRATHPLVVDAPKQESGLPHA